MKKTNNAYSFFSLHHFLAILLLITMAFSVPGCKSKKKAAERAAKEKAEAEATKVRDAKTKLNSLLSDKSKSIEELQEELDEVKAKNIDDPEVQKMIQQVEEKIEGEKARRAAEAEANKPENKLKNYFSQISNASSTGIANHQIKEALGLFSSKETPVLIIIGEFNGQKDYDQPTTISKYLNYLKDQKKNPNKIENIVFDESGKIKELELRKK